MGAWETPSSANIQVIIAIPNDFLLQSHPKATRREFQSLK